MSPPMRTHRPRQNHGEANNPVSSTLFSLIFAVTGEEHGT